METIIAVLSVLLMRSLLALYQMTGEIETRLESEAYLLEEIRRLEENKDEKSKED